MGPAGSGDLAPKFRLILNVHRSRGRYQVVMSPDPRPLASAVVPMKRMNREEFFGKLAALDEERLKKALWNLYWCGSATMRERIEAELAGQNPRSGPVDHGRIDATGAPIRTHRSVLRLGVLVSHTVSAEERFTEVAECM